MKRASTSKADRQEQRPPSLSPFMGSACCRPKEVGWPKDLKSLSAEYDLTVQKLQRLIALAKIMGLNIHDLNRLHASFNTMGRIYAYT